LPEWKKAVTRSFDWVQDKRRNGMTSPWLGEVSWHPDLILLGDGVVAAVLLKNQRPKQRMIVITTGWAFAVMCGVFIGDRLAEATTRI